MSYRRQALVRNGAEQAVRRIARETNIASLPLADATSDHPSPARLGYAFDRMHTTVQNTFNSSEHSARRAQDS
jgi:hypothetical protein